MLESDNFKGEYETSKRRKIKKTPCILKFQNNVNFKIQATEMKIIWDLETCSAHPLIWGLLKFYQSRPWSRIYGDFKVFFSKKTSTVNIFGFEFSQFLSYEKNTFSYSFQVIKMVFFALYAQWNRVQTLEVEFWIFVPPHKVLSPLKIKSPFRVLLKYILSRNSKSHFQCFVCNLVVRIRIMQQTGSWYHKNT